MRLRSGDGSIGDFKAIILAAHRQMCVIMKACGPFIGVGWNLMGIGLWFGGALESLGGGRG